MKIVKFFLSHKAHTIIIVLASILVVFESYQTLSVAKIGKLSLDNKRNIDELSKMHHESTIRQESGFMEINSRIDIVDSAVKLNEKRTMLVTKIRNAITETSGQSIDIRTLNRMAIAVIDYSYEYNLSVSKVLAQIKQESNFNYRAQSGAGATGLMQIMPDTHRYIMLKMGKPAMNPWDIEDNIHMGCFYMAEQIAEFGNFEDALRAYNSGPNMVRRVNAGLSDYWTETQNYVPAILKWVEVYRKYGLE